MIDWLIRLVARLPASVHAKLLAAFLAMVVLLITIGAIGLQVLSAVNRRAEEVVTLHRKIAAYRQLQHDTTGQLYSVTSALFTSSLVRRSRRSASGLACVRWSSRPSVAFPRRMNSTTWVTTWMKRS